jgi:hypothetical protein
MPTVLRIGPYRLFFYVGDRNEPPHIHVRREKKEAKFWLNPVRVAKRVGFRSVEVRRIKRIVQDNEQQLLEAWNEEFGR